MMKRELIAGLFLLTGGLWTLAIVCIVANNLLLNSNVSSLWSMIIEMSLLPQFAISTVLTIIGMFIDNG